MGSSMRISKLCARIVVLAAIALTTSVIANGRPDDAHWVGTWSASPQGVAAPIQLNGQTVRQIVHTSLGGERVRIRFSNAYGASGLVIGSAHVALSAGGGSIATRTDRVLKFNGSPTITIPAGALAVSDPVALDLPALGDLAVSLYLPENVAAATQHVESQQTTYISLAGRFRGRGHRGGYYDDVFLLPDRCGSPRLGPRQGHRDDRRFGDRGLRVDHRHEPALAEHSGRAAGVDWGTSRVAVLNAGVSGNRVLHDFLGTSALARFDRDVLVQTGVKYVVVLEGNADFLIPGLIGNPAEEVTAAQIIQAHRQMIDRGHALGLRVYGGTLNPVEGYPFPGFWTPAMEAKRQAVNLWIRTSNAYDAVIDFDRLLRDPSHPSRLLPAYDSGDHVHPNDIGYRAMADSIDLSLFRDHDED